MIDKRSLILVSGGAGKLGSQLVRGLLDKGYRVRVLALAGDPVANLTEGPDCEMARGDVSDRDSLLGLFDGVETVFHLAAVILPKKKELYSLVNVEGTRNVIQGAIEARAKHFVFVSSASVTDPSSSLYAESKTKAENIVSSQNSIQYTIVRPTLIYGPGGGKEFDDFLEYLKKYKIVPFIGRGRGMKNPVASPDIIKGLLAIAGNESAFGKTYNFSGGEEISIRDLARLLTDHFNLKRVFIPVPIWLCRIMAFAMESVSDNPLLTQYAISRIQAQANIDNSSAREDLGFDPLGISEGIKIYL